MNSTTYNNEMTLEQYNGYTEVITDAQCNDEAYIQSLYNYGADLMINQGYDQDETISALMEKGVDFNMALIIAQELQTAINKEEKSGDAGTDIGLGILFAVGGILLSLNTNYIFYGAVIYGIFRFFKGLTEL